MTIKKKLILVGIVVLVSMLSIMGAGQYAMTHVLKAQKIEDALNIIRKDITLLNRTKLSFLLNLEKKYEKQFANEYRAVKSHLEQVNKPIVEFGIDPGIKKDLMQSIEAYNDAFRKLYAAQSRIGFHSEDGLYGSMRKASHILEAKIKAMGNDTFYASELLLRRHEKDFMLRLQDKYVEKYDAEFNRFNSLVDNAAISSQDKKTLKQMAEVYKGEFHSLVRQNQVKGYNKSEGLIGEMNASSERATMLLNQLVSEMQTIIKEDIGSVDQLLIVIDVLGIIALIGVLAVIGFIGASITLSAQRMRDLMQKIAKTKNLTLRYEIKNKAKAVDAISLSGIALNDMLDSFQDIINNVSNASVQMRDSASLLASNSLQTSQGAQHQSQKISELAQSMDAMSNTIDIISESAENSAKISKETDLDCHEGQKIVASSANSIKALENSISVASQSIQKLQQDSESIGSVLDVIRGIAEQTNLLALNAAIEAARAGEQGRGFAVVADEVRTLAGRTQNSTTEIQEMIESLQSISLEAVSIMDKSLKDTQQGVEHVMKTDESLKRIVSSVSNLNSINKQIASLTEQQKEASQEINDNVHSINRVSSEAAKGSKESAKSVQQLSELAQDLSKSSSQFKV